jgi:hypothetical protein
MYFFCNNFSVSRKQAVPDHLREKRHRAGKNLFRAPTPRTLFTSSNPGHPEVNILVDQPDQPKLHRHRFVLARFKGTGINLLRGKNLFTHGNCI